jgi:hypothetical protein
MEVIVYVPEGTSVETRVGPPPNDQSAEVAQLKGLMELLNEAVAARDRTIAALEQGIANEGQERERVEAERDALLADVARLQRELDLLTHPVPQWVGPDIVVPAGISGSPLAPFNVAAHFTGTRLLFVDNDALDSVGLSTEGAVSGTYPHEPDDDDDQATLVVRAVDPWGRFAESPPIVVVGQKPVAPPPPPPPPPPVTIAGDDSHSLWCNWRTKTGPKATRYNAGLGLRWKNLNGDWLDKAGTPQGPVPWYTLTVAKATPLGYQAFDITELAARWLAGANRGLMMNVPTTTNVAAWVSWAGTMSATPPQLVVKTDKGEFTFRGDLCGWVNLKETATTAGSATDASYEFKLNRQTRVVLQFAELKKAAGALISAQLRLHANANDDIYPMAFDVFEIDSTPMIRGGGGAPPVYGLQAEVGWEGLKNHPDVLIAGDMREENWNNTPGTHPGGNYSVLARVDKPARLLNHFSMTKRQYDKSTVGVDPQTGRHYLRTCVVGPILHPPGSGYVATSKDTVHADGSITQIGNIGGGEWAYRFHKVNTTDPTLPPDPATRETELYQHSTVWFEPDSFWSRIGGIKFGSIGWDLRYGVGDALKGWNDKGGARYVFGSGQTDSDGKAFWASEFQQWGGKGHSIRGHSVGHPHPTDNCFTDVLGLGYAPSHLGRVAPDGTRSYDQVWDEGIYGTEQCMNISNHVIPKGRWVAMESYIKLNTIDMSIVDARGNGRARNDGILRVSLDGVLVGERTELAWHQTPQMGIMGTYGLVYAGGTTPTDHDIWWRVRDVVVARRYIGPPAGGV